MRLKRNHATRELPEDDTQTVDVTLSRICDRRVLHPLGGDIGHDTKETGLGGIDGLVDRLAESKVGDQGFSASVDEDIARVKVGMENVFAMDKVESASHLPGESVLGEPGDGDVLGLEIVLQTPILCKLHNDACVVGKRVFRDAKELDDIVGIVNLFVHLKLFAGWTIQYKAMIRQLYPEHVSKNDAKSTSW